MSEISVAPREKNAINCKNENYGDKEIFKGFNNVRVSGIIEEEFGYSHETFGTKFYRTRVIVKRLSGTEDCVPIVVSESLLLEGSLKGKYAEVGGQLRSHKKLGKDGRWHLDLFLFATEINVHESEGDFENVINTNLIYLDGYICKPPVFRITPFGRKITNLVLEVGRAHKKCDYIPCIAWGVAAQTATKWEVGDRVKLYGRVQSREYFKRFSPDSEEGENRITYEISIKRMKRVRK